MILNNLLISGVLISLAVAGPLHIPERDEEDERAGRMLPGPPSGQDNSSDGASSTVVNLQTPAAPAGLYAIANVTIHQYPLSTSNTNANAQSPIGEDVSFWISKVDNNKPNFATEAFCNLTLVVSTVNLATTPAEMACKSRPPNSTAVSNGMANHSSSWNVTFLQQTESLLSGFNVIVSSRYFVLLYIFPPKGIRAPADWKPK